MCGMGLQSIIRWLIPREDHFYDYVEKQAVVAQLDACQSGAQRVQDAQLGGMAHRGRDASGRDPRCKGAKLCGQHVSRPAV